MTLEKLSLIRYYASSPNPYSDEYFLHMLRISPLYRDWETDRKSTRLNSSHSAKSRMPSSA